MGKLVTDTDAHLIIVGKPAPATERLAAQLSLADRVTFTHGLDDEAFSALLASAETAAVPSLYEGFSLPAVEHMASGTPLVASRTGALPEVTGDAAVLVTPGEDEERLPSCGGCTTPPPNGAGSPIAPCAGSVSGSPGPPWPRRPWHATWRPGPDGPRADRRFPPVPRPVRPPRAHLGCGGGRHAFEVYRRGASVVASTSTRPS